MPSWVTPEDQRPGCRNICNIWPKQISGCLLNWSSHQRVEKKIPLEPSKHSLCWSRTPFLLLIPHAHTLTRRARRLNPSQPPANPLYLFPARWGRWKNSWSPMSSIQFVMPSKGACKLPICSYVIVTMGGSAVLGLNYLLIAVVEIKPPASKTQRCPAPETHWPEDSFGSQGTHDLVYVTYVTFRPHVSLHICTEVQ